MAKKKRAAVLDEYLEPEVEESLDKRLARIEGHIRGIRRMLSEREDCDDMLMQMTAVKAALNQAMIYLLEGHMSSCVARAVRDGNEGALDSLREAVATALKRS